ncbi:MAG: hypothetical protein KAS93_04400 [Gammaproteobacteria bacterium]|nr:hypothetical protein [Gammaproteobacteria bacterium]
MFEKSRKEFKLLEKESFSLSGALMQELGGSGFTDYFERLKQTSVAYFSFPVLHDRKQNLIYASLEERSIHYKKLQNIFLDLLKRHEYEVTALPKFAQQDVDDSLCYFTLLLELNNLLLQRYKENAQNDNLTQKVLRAQRFLKIIRKKSFILLAYWKFTNILIESHMRRREFSCAAVVYKRFTGVIKQEQQQHKDSISWLEEMTEDCAAQVPVLQVDEAKYRSAIFWLQEYSQNCLDGQRASEQQDNQYIAVRDWFREETRRRFMPTNGGEAARATWKNLSDQEIPVPIINSEAKEPARFYIFERIKSYSDVLLVLDAVSLVLRDSMLSRAPKIKLPGIADKLKMEQITQACEKCDAIMNSSMLEVIDPLVREMTLLRTNDHAQALAHTQVSAFINSVIDIPRAHMAYGKGLLAEQMVWLMIRLQKALRSVPLTPSLHAFWDAHGQDFMAISRAGPQDLGEITELLNKLLSIQQTAIYLNDLNFATVDLLFSVVADYVWKLIKQNEVEFDLERCLSWLRNINYAVTGKVLDGFLDSASVERLQDESRSDSGDVIATIDFYLENSSETMETKQKLQAYIEYIRNWCVFITQLVVLHGERIRLVLPEPQAPQLEEIVATKPVGSTPKKATAAKRGKRKQKKIIVEHSEPVQIEVLPVVENVLPEPAIKELLRARLDSASKQVWVSQERLLSDPENDIEIQTYVDELDTVIKDAPAGKKYSHLRQEARSHIAKLRCMQRIIILRKESYSELDIHSDLNDVVTKFNQYTKLMAQLTADGLAEDAITSNQKNEPYSTYVELHKKWQGLFQKIFKIKYQSLHKKSRNAQQLLAALKEQFDDSKNDFEQLTFQLDICEQSLALFHAELSPIIESAANKMIQGFAELEVQYQQQQNGIKSYREQLVQRSTRLSSESDGYFDSSPIESGDGSDYDADTSDVGEEKVVSRDANRFSHFFPVLSQVAKQRLESLLQSVFWYLNHHQNIAQLLSAYNLYWVGGAFVDIYYACQSQSQPKVNDIDLVSSMSLFALQQKIGGELIPARIPVLQLNIDGVPVEISYLACEQHESFEQRVLRSLRERDITMGAIAYSLKDETFIDASTGIDDLLNGRVHCSSQQLLKDPLQILRVIRYLGKYRSFVLSEALQKLFVNTSSKNVKDSVRTLSSACVATAFSHLLFSGCAFKYWCIAREHKIFPLYFALLSVNHGSDDFKGFLQLFWTDKNRYLNDALYKLDQSIRKHEIVNNSERYRAYYDFALNIVDRYLQYVGAFFNQQDAEAIGRTLFCLLGAPKFDDAAETYRDEFSKEVCAKLQGLYSSPSISYMHAYPVLG